MVGESRSNRRRSPSTVPFCNFCRCFNKVIPGSARSCAAPALAGASKVRAGRSRLVAQLHREVESTTLIGKGGAGEARRPEGRGGIVREAVALLGLAEQASLHLRLILALLS